MSALDYWPRRADGLPPGQREVRRMPRFSDKPLRWAPVPGPVELTISVDGEPRRTLVGADWDVYGSVEQTSDFHCVTTWSYRGLQWGGIRLARVLEDVIGTLPPHAVAHAADRQSAVFVTDDLIEPNVLLATRLDGEPLSRRHGAPLRLVCPGQYGYKSVKHLTGIDLLHDEPASAIGPKEHRRARVDREERHATLPNWAVRLPYRLIVVPTALAAERGLRQSPD